MNQTREYVFHAEREKYAEAARDALAKASKSMLDKMTELAQKQLVSGVFVSRNPGRSI